MNLFQNETRSRTVVAGLLAAVAVGAVARAQAPKGDDYTFFVIGDPQIHMVKWGSAGTEKTVDAMNRLPGADFPAGGKVAEPRALLILGDLIDDTNRPTDWDVYKGLFDPQGKARFKYKVYEGTGNHDMDFSHEGADLSWVQKEVIARHKTRKDPFHYDDQGFHYSWDWGRVHYVQLDAFPGDTWRECYDRPTKWNDPQKSLTFLKRDLKERVGGSGRPVILMWHYGLRGWGLEKWWKPEDLANLKAAIAPYNVVLILHGHEHAYDRYRWEGHDVIMAPSPQADRDPKTPNVPSTPKGFLVVRVKGDLLETALKTPTGWSEVWSKTMNSGKPMAR